MISIYDLQRDLYGRALELLTIPDGGGSLGILLPGAFVLGLVHALLPGHGKSVLVSHYGGSGRALEAVATSAILILTHVGSAIALVLAGSVVLTRTIGGAGRAPVLEQASGLLIVAIGSWLLWRALRPSPHRHDRSGPFLGFALGLVPCPLTTFIMTLAVTRGVVAQGLVLTSAFAAGMIVTVAILPVLAVISRERLVPLLAGTERLRAGIGKVLEVGGAATIIAIGVIGLMS